MKQIPLSGLGDISDAAKQMRKFKRIYLLLKRHDLLLIMRFAKSQNRGVTSLLILLISKTH